MLTRVAAFLAIAVLSLSGQDRYFDLLHISDTHVASLAGVHPELAAARRLLQDPGEKLVKFVAEAARIPRSRVLHTGDIVDAICFDGEADGPPVYGQIELAKKLLAPLPAPPLLVMGNHDVECYRRSKTKKNTAVGDQSVAAEARKLWGRHFPGLRRGTYFTERIRVGARTYRLIAIDNGEALATGQAFFDEQMRWFERELARQPRDPVIVALHIPVAGDPKSQAIRARLSKAAQVELVLSGHRHTDAMENLELGSRRILQVRTAGMHISSTFWRRVRLYEDRIEIYATGEPERLLETVKLAERSK